VLGQFHEISLPTPDIRASVEFYELLGFTQAETGDAWPHPYGVVSDGRVFLGLHQDQARSPAITFVQPDVAAHASALERQGVELVIRHTDPEVFNELGLRDPAGQLITVIEARTYSPVARRPEATSLCGYFAHFSMPTLDFAAAQRYWEPLGFVATEECVQPYPHLPLTSDHLDVAFHSPQWLPRAALVFVDENMTTRIARVRELGVREARTLPGGLAPGANALLEAPEGTLLLLLTAPG
jgi:catechol 2,3-dioxygenase-like lactoylglutathione lyase family enzyme